MNKKIIFLIPFIIIVSILVVFILNKQNQDESQIPTDKDVIEQPIEEKTKKLSLIAVGDILIHDSVYKDAYNKETDTYDFSHMFTEIEPIIKNYDLKFCNQESIIGGKIIGISGYPRFNSPDEIGDELVDLGFNLISLANNHTLDKGEDAVLYSNSYWKSKQVVTAGSYSNMEDRNKINVYESNGVKYAFLAYVATAVNGGVPKKPYLLNVYSEETVKSDIEAVQDKVDVIIVSMHWGVEDKNKPNDRQRSIAKYLSSLGVDIILGHHPHVVQPVEYIDNTIVVYSLGNFISNQLVLGINNGIGLMYGIDIIVEDGNVRFENEYKELVLAYSNKSTNFKVIPFSKLNNDLLNNYVDIEKKYMDIVNNEVSYD